MDKDIRYGGYTANTSEYDCQDGELSLALGVVSENGALMPVMQPKVIAKIPDGYDVLFVHKSATYTNYIICNGVDLKWCSDKSTLSATALCKGDSIIQVNAIGNTLIVLSTSGMQYFLWAKDGYKFLGAHLPELDLSFGLQATVVRKDQFEINVEGMGIPSENLVEKFFTDNPTFHEWPFGEEGSKRVTEPLLAKVNKFIADHATNSGKFLFPFFVRYAYRLYDGSSLSMHSAPILMACSSDVTPQCFVGFVDLPGLTKALKVELSAALHELDYAAVKQSQIDELKKWEDIVKSVDIFVSKPIYTYDQNGKCSGIVMTKREDCYSVCKNVSSKLDTAQYPQRYQEWKFTHMYAATFDPSGLTMPKYKLRLPGRDSEAVHGDIMDNQLFYLLKSINIDDLKTDRTIIPIGKEYLQSLTNREAMTDDYDSHDTILPEYSYVYNSRLNLANLKKRLYNGYGAASLFCHTNGYIAVPTPQDGQLADMKCLVKVYYFIKTDGEDKVVVSDAGVYGNRSKLLWLYYPNVNCHKAVVEVSLYAGGELYEVQMNPHPMLNGAFYFSGWEGITKTGKKVSAEPTMSGNTVINIKNKIYTSEVNNPFYFPVQGINTVGVGEVFALSSATKALSQGQFGQFPLYVFTDEGVWAMEVSKTGGYSVRQPVTRDVCTDKGSIAQTDSAVLFATDRGIMLLSGAQAKCISEELVDNAMNNVHLLPGIQTIVSEYNKLKAASEPVLSVADFTLSPMYEFMDGMRMVYDYAGQKIVAYHPRKKYAYVYSFASGKWGMMRSNLRSNVNSYPEALAMDNANNLVVFDGKQQQQVTALIVSRSMVLGAPDVYKAVNRIIQRGILDNAKDMLQVLYGSNDGQNWLPVWNSTKPIMAGFRGTAYKMFRLLLVVPMDKKKSISAASFEFVAKWNNRIR